MRRLLKVLVFTCLAAAFLMGGCSSSTTQATFTDSAQAISVKPNQEFSIALQSNPTTGYDWKAEVDPNLISSVKDEYKADDKAGKNIVGSGGTHYFTYKALKAGETTLTFTYRRSWEQPSPDDKKQSFKVTIK